MKKILFILLAMTLVVACRSEIDGKPAAQVGEVQEPETTEKAEPEAPDTTERVVDIDVANSEIGWVGAKVTGDHTGGFNTWTGKATLAGVNLKALEFTVDTTSIHSDNDRLTGHLKSEDFFEVETYPEAKFVSTAIAEGSEEEGYTHTVTGNMTIKETTRSISFPARVTKDGDNIVAESEFTLMRFQFGIEFKGKADDLIRDEVLMKIKLTIPAA